MLTLIISSLVVLLVAAFASCTEAALFSVSLPKAKAMAAAHKPGGKALLKIKENMGYPIGTIVIVNNIATIVGSIVEGVAAHEVFGDTALSIFIAIFTFCVIVFSEIVPKTLGESYAVMIAPIVAPIVLFLTQVFKPLLWLIEQTLKKLKPMHDLQKVSEEEIKIMAAMGQKSGSIEPDETAMIRHVFKLNDITAEDMMTPLSGVETILGDLRLGEGRETILGANHSRLPVIADDGETVLGVVLTRDLIAALARDRFEATPLDYIQEAINVPMDLPADDLLPLFQKREQHLGVVIDPAGRMVGVVSLEDVIEELVGEITDEKDVRPETIKRISKTEILADEGTEVAKINHFFNTSIVYEGTVGDYAAEKLSKRPRPGDSVTHGPLTFTVVSMTRTRPKLLKIAKNA